MKSLSRYILVLWGMLAFSVLVNGQSIDSLVNQAISANPELKAMELEYDAAMLSGRQYGQLPDPELGLGVFALQPETRVGPQWFRFGVMQMLPWKGTLDARVTLEDRKARVKLEDVASKKLRLILAVNQAYLDLYQYQEEAQILKRKQTLFRSLEALALSRVESGMGDLADVLLVQLQSSELELEIQKLENKRHIPLAELNALRAAPARQEIFISDSLGFAFIP
ncbi:MAG: TolC family protein, partial [Saprospiraceae bacterium]|nr:TolC family protein [Saprospiraceae bacterium]